MTESSAAGRDSRAAIDGSTREAARGTQLMLVGIVVYQLLEYGYRFVLARGLGVAGFGTFTQARAAFLVFVVFASLGIGLGVKRFVALFREAGRGAEARRTMQDGSRLALATSVAGGVFFFFAAGALASFFRNPDLEVAIQILAVGVPFTIGLDYLTRLGEAFRSFAATVFAKQVLEPALRFGTSLALLAVGAALPMFLGAFVASALVALIVAEWLVLRIPERRELAKGAASSQTSELLRFSLPLALGGVLFDFTERVDVLMLGIYREEADIGVYAAASALARGLLLFHASAMPAAGTLAAEAVGRGAPQDITRLLRLTARWALLFATPFALGLLLYPREVLSILFGGEYVEGAATLRVLVLGCLVVVLSGPMGLFLNTLGKTQWTMMNMVARTALNVALNVLLIPRYGIVGAAISTMLSLIFAVSVFAWQLSRLVPTKGVFEGWGRPLLVLAVSGGAGVATSHLIRTSGIAGENAAALAGGLVLLILFAFGVKRVPGCLREGDLELVSFLRGWAPRFLR
jgi:O-antigen/teichoic acid export membrane protein